jgi:O-antigen/teichoic acid export membrane protein
VSRTGSDSPPPGVDGRDLLDTPGAGVAAIRGGAYRILGYVIGVAVSVLSSALLLRHLGVVATGGYVTVLSLVTLAGGVTDLGLGAIGVRELSTLSRAAGQAFFRNLIGLRLVFTLGAGTFACAFALLSGYSSRLVIGTLLASGGFALAGLGTSYSLPLLADLRLGWVTAVELLRQLGTSVTIVILVLLGASLLPFWAATVPAGIIALVVSALLIRRSEPLLPAFDLSIWGALARRTLPYSVATAVGIVYFRLAILILSHVTTAQQTGYYGASFRIIEVLFVAPQLIVGSMLPIFARAARDDRARLDYALGRTFDVCLLLGLATGLALITGAHSIIDVIAGPKFGPSAAVLRVQGLALIATFVGAVLGYALLSLERYRVLLWINLTVLLLSGILTGLLGASYGALGAALATAVVEVLYTALLAIALLRAGTRPQVSVAGAPRAGIAALLGGLVLLPPDLPNAVRPVLAVAIYLAALLLLRAVPAELLEQLPRRLHPRHP